ncbi:MAG: hypothetical protein ACXAEU_04110 [Candidatus Hodarchaeales archaeon]|jgi:hypothetical protein
MSASELSFEILPRFYITCFYKDKNAFSTFKDDLDVKFADTGFEMESLSVNEISPFDYRDYSHLGFIEIKLKPLPTPAPEPAKISPISWAIDSLCKEYNEKHADKMILDVYNPPYAVNIATEVSKKIDWTEEAILEHRHSIGKWIEFYSGQWPDYSKQLYLSRVENNISNRLSELHYIRVNSAFVLMPGDWWFWTDPEKKRQGGGDYMKQYFIEQILRVRSLLFCYYILNQEIDTINRKFPELKKSPLVKIEEEIGRLEDLARLIEELSSRVFKERIINRRAHSKKVLDVCFKLYQIELARKEIEDKIVKLQQALSSERAVHQTILSNQQRRWLLILNLLIGSQIMFTIKDQVVNIFSIDDPALVSLIDTGLIAVVAIAVGIAIIGLLYTWLSKRIKIKDLLSKKPQ